MIRVLHKTMAAAAGAALALACAACAPAAPTAQTAQAPSATPTPSWTASLSGGDHAQAQSAPPLPVPSWDAASEQGAKDTAAKAMALFARPRVDQRQWITDLAPMLSPAYRTEAEYINPARVPVSRVLSGPALQASSGDPMTVKAVFTTDAGEWAVLLHRTAAAQPWLVQDIATEDA
ncbi:Putative lipoprotein (plasmid) [Sinomonas atrocyanea]|uniref:Putative lipoprotein n=1 Tax=Sinomonas atrocyanea TaxID=37927 RepID=A0A127AAV9_9MICC|nr:Putative lipoprotein [Sinomonas atrocyanea]GEB64611.1 hypothetical protein SAT01_20590 [Sinomonas atrocyanea]